MTHTCAGAVGGSPTVIQPKASRRCLLNCLNPLAEDVQMPLNLFLRKPILLCLGPKVFHVAAQMHRIVDVILAKIVKQGRLSGCGAISDVSHMGNVPTMIRNFHGVIVRMTPSA